MNFHWARTNRFLLVLLAIAVAILGVLTTLVMQQQHDQSTVDGQIHLRTAPTGLAASVPAGADIMATAKAATPANAVVPPPITPARGRTGAPDQHAPELAPSPQTPLERITVPHRRVHPVPAPPPAAAAHPVAPAPPTDPATPTRSATPAKPGSPDGW